MLLKLALNGCTHANGRGVVGAKVRVFAFNLLQLAEELIVLPISEIGFVQDVVLVAGFVEKLSKLLRPSARVGLLRLIVLRCWH